jgi:hypothetical protein
VKGIEWLLLGDETGIVEVMMRTVVLERSILSLYIFSASSLDRSFLPFSSLTVTIILTMNITS